MGPINFIEDQPKLKLRIWDSLFDKFLDPSEVVMDAGTGNLHGSKSQGNVEHWHYVLPAGFTDCLGRPVYDGDIFKVDTYPFTSDGDLNYLGVVTYIYDLDYLGWYYDIYPISDRVRGSACGSSLCDVSSNPTFEVVGNILTDPGMLEVKNG